MNLTHRIFMKYGVYGMNRIWSMMKRFLLIGLLVTILPFFMMPGFDVSAEDYIAPDPPETINLFGDKLHPVYIGTTWDHMYIYTTQESLDNLLAYKGYDGKSWELYIIVVPGTEKLHKDTVSTILKNAEKRVTWLPAKSRTLWGTGVDMSLYGFASGRSLNEEYYNLNGEIIGFQHLNDEDFIRVAMEDTSRLLRESITDLITDFVNKWYDEHKMDKYNNYIQ